MTLLTVIDDAGNGGVATMDRDEVAASLREWFSEAPADVLGWLDELQTALNRGESTEDLQTALGIRIQVTNVSDAALRIAAGVNAFHGNGNLAGKVAFDRDGYGGQWFSKDVLDFGSHLVVLPCGDWISMTPADAQEILDHLDDEGE